MGCPDSALPCRGPAVLVLTPLPGLGVARLLKFCLWWAFFIFLSLITRGVSISSCIYVLLCPPPGKCLFPPLPDFLGG